MKNPVRRSPPLEGKSGLPAGVILAASLLVGPWAALSDNGDASRFTFARALGHALSHNPGLQAGAAELAKARARLQQAETYPHNPELEGQGAARLSSGSRSFDWSAGLSQEIEIGSQGSHRATAASSALEAAQKDFVRSQRLVATDVTIAFTNATRARELLNIEDTHLKVASELLRVAKERSLAGSATRLDVNVANSELGHAEQRFYFTRAEYREAQAILAETMGLRPNARPEPTGELSLPAEPVASLDELLEGAAERRADLAAVAFSVRSAQARLQLARAEAYPNLTVRAFVGQEGGAETLVGGGLSLPIPLFDRNLGGIREADAAKEGTVAKATRARLKAEREVVAMHARYQASLASATSLGKRVIGTLKDNLTLLRQSFEAGKIGLTDVLVIRRRLLESQAAHVETLAAANVAHAQLMLAAGMVSLSTADLADVAAPTAQRAQP